MIDDMLCPFAMKAVDKQLNSLQVDILGRTPESILHGVEVQDIPVKSYHTVFCPTYVLDARLQSDGGLGLPKWKPRSIIGVYLGHSTLHAGSVALVCNPTTVRVSPQYHIVFNDDFSTMPSMTSGTLPPNLEYLVKYSSEMATTKDVNLEDTWFNGQFAEVATDQLSDPFAIVTDHTKRPRKNTPVSPSPSKIIHTSNSEGYNSHGMSSLSSKNEQVNQAATNPFASVGSSSSNKVRAGAHTNIFGSNPTFASRNHDSEVEALKIPARLNPHENGMRRSPRLREQ